MEKISAKRVMFALLPVLLLLQFSILVAAVDINFFSSKTACTGTQLGCGNIGSDVCCGPVDPSKGGSVLVHKTKGSSAKSYYYRQGGCKTQVGHGAGEFCLTGTMGQFTGAKWHQSRRRSLLTDSAKCNGVMDFNVVGYTEDSTKGHWLLTTSNATEMYSQLENLPDAEKVNWLRSLGATYN